MTEDDVKKTFMERCCKVCGSQRCGGIYDSDYASGCQKWPVFLEGSISAIEILKKDLNENKNSSD